MKHAAHPLGPYALLLWLGLGLGGGGWAGCAGEPIETLPSGLELGQGVVLVGARTYPVEPMSPTSGRCALRLEHRASATWTEVFPQAGWQRPATIDNGDVHFADGRQRMKPPTPVAPAYTAALAELRRRVAGLTGDQLVAQCRTRDRQRPAASRFAVPGALALLLLLGAVLIRQRAGGVSLFLALAGLGGLLWTAWPVLGGESFGSQELQRVLSSLRPWRELLAGNDGDARHPAGLYLAYAPVARLTGTVFGLRLFGFVLLALAFAAWVVARWRRHPGEALVGLALLVHPVLLKNSLEVGPYAIYVVGVLGLWLAVGGREELSRLRFGLGLAAVVALAAVNHVATVVAPALLLVAVLRSRGGISRVELGIRLAVVLVAVLPFVVPSREPSRESPRCARPPNARRSSPGGAGPSGCCPGGWSGPSSWVHCPWWWECSSSPSVGRGAARTGMVWCWFAWACSRWPPSRRSPRGSGCSPTTRSTGWCPCCWGWAG